MMLENRGQRYGNNSKSVCGVINDGLHETNAFDIALVITKGLAAMKASLYSFVSRLKVY